MPVWLTGIAAKLIGIAILCAVVSAGIGWTVHQIDTVKYDDLVIKDKQALIDAQTIARLLQEKQDALANKASIDEAVNQQRIADANNRIIQRIPTYVKDTDHCITYGLVRVLDAAATNRDPSELPLAPGKLDGSCAPVTNTALAANVASNYGLANQNAEQLDALEASVNALHDAAVPPTPAPQPSWWERTFGSK